MAIKPLDTSDEGWKVQREAHARMGGEARVRTAIELSEAVRALQLNGILARNPTLAREDAVRVLIGAMVRSQP